MPTFFKVKRFVSDEALRQYRAAHPHCELARCPRGACPEPHHLVQRSSGRSDIESNLLSLCAWHHTRWHCWGGRYWFRRYGDRLEEYARRKVMKALRIEGEGGEGS